MKPLRVYSSLFCGLPNTDASHEFLLRWLMVVSTVDKKQLFKTHEALGYIDQEPIKVSVKMLSNSQIKVVTIQSAPRRQEDPEKEWLFQSTILSNRLGVSVINTIVNGDLVPCAYILGQFGDDCIGKGENGHVPMGKIETCWVDYVHTIMPWVMDAKTVPATPLSQECPFKALQEREAFVLSDTGAFSASIREFARTLESRAPHLCLQNYAPFIPKDLNPSEFPKSYQYPNRSLGFLLSQQDLNEATATIYRRYQRYHNNPVQLAKQYAPTTKGNPSSIRKIEKAHKAHIRLTDHNHNIHLLSDKSLLRDAKLVKQMSKTINHPEFASVLKDVTLPSKALPSKPIDKNFKPAFERRDIPAYFDPLAKKRGKPQIAKKPECLYAELRFSIEAPPRLNVHSFWLRHEEERERAEAEALAQRTEKECLEQEITDLKQRNQVLEDELLTLEVEVEKLRQETHNAQIKARALQSSFKANKSKDLISIDAQEDLSSDLLLMLMANNDYPLSVIDALKIIEHLANEHIIVLETAKDSASALPLECLQGRRLLNLLTRLALKWKPIYETQGDNIARQVFSPGEYASRESQTVERSNKASLRTYVYDGREFVMMRHLRIGTAWNDRFCIRVHFEYDAATKKIVIGHCGSHLEC